MNIISKSKIWLSISTVLVVLSIVLLAVFGLKLGIDFTGGSLLEVKYFTERPEVGLIEEKLSELDLGNINIQPTGASNVILKFKNVGEEKHQEILSALDSLVSGEEVTEETANAIATTADGREIPINITPSNTDDSKVELSNIEEMRFDSVGPSIGEELKIKSFYAIIIVLILIVMYIAWTFRRVSKPVASWKYGITAIIALFHDTLIVLGVFAVLGKVMGVELDTAFIAAILTVLGYSVNDTIVVFDRVRENLPKSDTDFASTINTSLNQTITRSINTSITTLLVLLAILFFGGETIKYFVLALTIGVVAGTYSSIFLASPLLVVWEKMKK